MSPLRALILLSLVLGVSFIGITPPAVHATVITVTTTDDELNTDGDCSLREAIQAANLNIPVDDCEAGSNTTTDEIILLSGATHTIAISGIDEFENQTGSFDIIDNNVDIDVKIISSSGTATVNGANLDRIFYLPDTVGVIFSNIILTDGQALWGGAIMGGAKLRFYNCILENNEATGFAVDSMRGGAIYTHAALLLDNTIVRDNYAKSEGGGIFISGNMLTIQNNSEITHNVSRLNGGGIFLGYASGIITDSQINSNNTDAGSGGGIYVQSSKTLTLNHISVSNNAKSAIVIASADEVTIVDSQFNSNHTLGSMGGGGAIYYRSSGTLNIINSVFTDNRATTAGGAIFTHAGSISITNSTFSNNSQGHVNYSGTGGGAIYFDFGAAVMNISDTRFLDNHAKYDGGLIKFGIISDTQDFNINNSCIVNNTDQNGVAIYNPRVYVQNAEYNWWGASAGPGIGDSVIGAIDVNPYLTSPILGCPWKNGVLTDTPTDTFTPSDTPTNTPTWTASATATHTPTNTFTHTPSFTASDTTAPTFTFTPSHTHTFTPSLTACVLVATAPTLISPDHRAHTTDPTPTFRWRNVTGAQSYRLMIYLEDRSFEYKKRTFNTSYTLTSSEALVPAKYLWRVRTQDQACSTWTTWSQRNTLFVD